MAAWPAEPHRAMMLYDYNAGLAVLGLVSWRGGKAAWRPEEQQRLSCLTSLTHRPSYRSIVRVPTSNSTCTDQGRIPHGMVQAL